MTIERTLSIIKPDAVAKNVIGQIYARFEAAGIEEPLAAQQTTAGAAALLRSEVARWRPLILELGATAE